MSEAEMVNKLAHHFSRGIQIAVITQGIKTIEELLLLLTKWENVDSQNSDSNQTSTLIQSTHKQHQHQYQQQYKHKQSIPKYSQHKVASVNENKPVLEQHNIVHDLMKTLIKKLARRTISSRMIVKRNDQQF